jgi:hypothetical protein
LPSFSLAEQNEYRSRAVKNILPLPFVGHCAAGDTLYINRRPLSQNFPANLRFSIQRLPALYFRAQTDLIHSGPPGSSPNDYLNVKITVDGKPTGDV